jgi:CYTH domain-containing protein
MLSTVCGDQILEKQRFFVEDAGAIWYVDAYGGLLQGVVIAAFTLDIGSSLAARYLDCAPL